MFISANCVEGIPARLYRSPAEIRREMLEILRKIRETNDMISVHALLTDILSEWARVEPERWITELEEALDTTLAAKKQLSSLQSSLDELREELENTRWALGM